MSIHFFKIFFCFFYFFHKSLINICDNLKNSFFNFFFFFLNNFICTRLKHSIHFLIILDLFDFFLDFFNCNFFFKRNLLYSAQILYFYFPILDFRNKFLSDLSNIFNNCLLNTKKSFFICLFSFY
jgi:hypothetical protein